MGKKYLWKIGGEAGFGIQTTGLVFSKIASRHGHHVFDYFEYPSLIRGGHNTTETIISDEEVFASKHIVDVLVCLNRETYLRHMHRLGPDSVVVCDETVFTIMENNFLKVHMPFKEILEKEKAPLVMMNNIAMGASLAIMGWDSTILDEILEATFARKGKEIVDANKKMAQLGATRIRDHYPMAVHDMFAQQEAEEKLILTGNDAFSLGAIVADCRLYSAYPMTPSSTVLTNLAGYADTTGMVVRHAEDEIAVINTALGASFAGVRAAVGSSGGGFALMVETISLAGVTEIPIVIFLAQRPGPATGMPTWSEQGDLLFAVNAGHGEFPKIVLAPGDVDEIYELAAKAFDLADIYQVPVIVLSDKHLGESHKSTSQSKFLQWSKSYTPDRGKIVSEVAGDAPYLRYKLTDDGISPMLIPGFAGSFYQANSYEHIEDGHTTEDAEPRIAQVHKRAQKMTTYLAKHFSMPAMYGDPDTAAITLVSWGSNKGAILEAIKILSEKGVSASYIHFTHLFPLDIEKVTQLFAQKRNYAMIENNSHGQFAQLLRQLTGVHIPEMLLRYDGRTFWPEDIISFIEKNL